MVEYKRRLHTIDIKARGISFDPCPYDAIQLKTMWENSFAKSLSNETKKNIFMNQYLWHSFSYGILNAKQKGKARQSFNQIKKESVYVFNQNKDETFLISDAQDLKAADFDFEEDVYIVDVDFRWTYVKTHEICCGPYYYRIKQA